MLGPTNTYKDYIPFWFVSQYTNAVLPIILLVVYMKLRLKDIREDRDIKQVDVAKFLNCTQVCYSRYENEQRDIPLNTLCLLAEFFDTTTDYILGLTDNPNKH